ncbi:diguanylate cyclase [Mycobacterium branderi]|uniref:Diguanylate cyclase n=1 Tax=Mycobacterium branderi TaxID=43348 RepID=A0ABM7KNW1_9MYCO|nr:diguanylate cyclase [Mycobacterium branderi]
MASDQDESAFTRLGERDLVRRMHEQLDELLAARDQMEQLLRIIVDIGSDLNLDVTLRRIVKAAMELTGARYGALGVYGSAGGLVSFVQAGIDAEMIRRLGSPAVDEVVRVDDLTAHPHIGLGQDDDSSMRALLGLPITLRGVVLGSLYLGDDRAGRVFSDADEAAARALAAAAAEAIDNAQLFERERATAKWIRASREILTALLSAEPQTGPLQLIVDRALELTDAEQAILLIPSEADLSADEVDELIVTAMAGQYAPEAIGQAVPVEGSTMGGAIRRGLPLITNSFLYPIEGFTDVGERSAIVMPLSANGSVLGVIAVAREAEKPPFSDDYLELVSDFARHAAIALALAAGREHARELAILADRERIAHDLHDHVIQKLFAAGLDLQGTIARSHSPEIVNRLTHTVDDLQGTIEDIRATIFRLQTPGELGVDFRERIQNRIAELTEDRDIATTVDIAGTLTAVTGNLADHAEAVVTEAVSNAVRHAQASRLTVRIEANRRLVIEVSDDGRGIPPGNQRRSGLANIERRAAQVGGECSITMPAGAAPGCTGRHRCREQHHPGAPCSST